MKKLYSAIASLISATFVLAQVDTVDNGTAIYIDSAQNLKMEIPFKKRMVNGIVKGFDLTTSSLISEGLSKNKQKQGVWNYFEYDSLGNKIIVEFFS